MGAGKARRSVLSLPSVTDENGFKYLSTTCLPQCRLLPIPSGGRCLILLTWSGLEQGRQADPRKQLDVGRTRAGRKAQRGRSRGRKSVAARRLQGTAREAQKVARLRAPRPAAGRGRGRGVQARTAPGTSGAQAPEAPCPVTLQKQRAALPPPVALAGIEGVQPLLAPAPGPASCRSPGSGRAEGSGSQPGWRHGSPRETGRERPQDPAEYKCEAGGRGRSRVQGLKVAAALANYPP